MTEPPPTVAVCRSSRGSWPTDTQRDEANEGIEPFVRMDANRMRRAGIPEVVFAGNKASAEIADALRRLVEANGRALASRVRPEDVRRNPRCVEPAISIDAHPAGTSPCRVPTGD